jgi:hypothetical protein
MIEFTILEITLLAMCIGLFIYGVQQHKRVDHFGMLIEAMCRDKRVYEQICKATRQADEEAA